MAERKKTRATSGRATKKPSAKKAAKKVSAKKAVSKKSTKVAKKPTTKKSRSQKASEKTSATKKTRQAPKKTQQKKSASKAAQAAKKRRHPKTTIQKFSDNVTIGTSHKLAFKEKSITVFSRVKTDSAIILVARVVGMAFIFTGVFFSVLALNRSYDTAPIMGVSKSFEQFLLANTLDSTNSDLHGDIQGSSLDTQSQNQSQESHLNNQQQQEQDTTEDNKALSPSVSFKLPSDPVSGDSAIQFSVQAKSVNVRLFSVSENRDFDLGGANTNDNLSWGKNWDTTKFLDGDYYVELIIIDTAGFTHYETSDRPIRVENVVDDYIGLEEENEDEETAQTDELDETDNPDAATTLTLDDLGFDWIHNIPDQITDVFNAEFIIDDAASVNAGVTHKESGNSTELTDVNEISSGRWVVVIDPAQLRSGGYQLMLQVRTADSTVVQGGKVQFGIPENADVSADDSTDINTAVVDQATVANSETEAEEVVVEPESIIHVANKDNLHGEVSVFADTEGASQTEVFIRRKDSLTDDFVGIAQHNGTQWRLLWDTRQTPNGDYEIFAKHKNEFGYYYSDMLRISIKNTAETQDPNEEEYVAELQDTADEIGEVRVEPKPANGQNGSFVPDRATTSPARASSTAEREAEREETRAQREAERLFTKYSNELNRALRAYTRALRNGDQENINTALAELESLKQRITTDAQDNPELQDLIDELDTEIDYKVEVLTRDVEKTERVIRDRVGDAIRKDSDGDGITDYDEVALYNTDPFSADSDNDGFNDDAEILGGYDPTDASQETPIVFESPKETGVVREDILVVEGIVADENPGPVSVESPIAPAIITGKALPNSFVRVYIFSTPIVVTVRTDDAGNWSYRFDKELEDGEHEVYVGVTDNGGKIVAKSEPFTFVKEAQAFTPVDAEAATAATVSTDTTPSLLDSNSLVIALAAVITSLGFVLLLISLFMGRREETAESSSLTSPDLAHGT